MPLLTNIGALARCLPSGPQSEIHVIPAAALAWEGDRIAWVGPEAELPERFRDWPREDAGGRLGVPGLVDSHTHLAFGGWRAGEFEQRLLGKSYLEIAAARGGIAATVGAPREASSEALLARCREHLAGMARLGVTTVEAKSGYGLTEEQELRLLGIYRDLGSGPQRLVPTLLAAHVVPEEYRGRRGKYVELIVERIIPRVASEGLARFCDAFVEETAFTPDEARRIFEAGKQHGLRPKLHADQLSPGGGAELAAEVGAASADHLERIAEEGIGKLAAAGVVAVSMPFASLYLGVAPLPARKLLDAGVPVAVATDFNPASFPIPSSEIRSRWSADAAPTSAASSAPPPGLSWSAWSFGRSPRCFPASKIRRASSGVKAVSSTNASQNRASPSLATRGMMRSTISSTYLPRRPRYSSGTTWAARSVGTRRWGPDPRSR